MIDEERDVHQEEESFSKPRKRGGGGIGKILVMILGLIVVLVIVFAIVWFFFMRDTEPAPMPQNQQSQGAPSATSPVRRQPQTTRELGPLYPFESFIVNLADPGGTRYLKVTLQVELSNKKLVEEVEMRKPQMRDTILTVLSSKTFDEISNAPGKLALKQEIIRRLNLVIASGEISNLYITEFVVQ